MARILHIQPGPREVSRGLAAVVIACAIGVGLWFAWRAAVSEAVSTEAVPAAPALRPAHDARASLPPLVQRPGPVAARREPAPAAVLAAVDAGRQPEAGDLRERNRVVDVARLTSSRPMLADAMLREVVLKPDPRGGFVVEEVVPGSRFERLGLRPGDRVQTLDTPANAAVDEGSMVALMQQTQIDLEVWRGGQVLHLVLALNRDDAADPGAAANGR